MPSKPVQVSLSAEAQADADAAVDWYIGEGALIAAEDFTDELGRALDLLNQFTALGESGTHNTRSLPLHGFPYSLIYRMRTILFASLPLPITAAVRDFGLGDAEISVLYDWSRL